MYFARNLDGDVVIHKAELENGSYTKVSKLEAAINYDCGDQVFSKNMDYIIFASPRKGEFRYCFKNKKHNKIEREAYNRMIKHPSNDTK